MIYSENILICIVVPLAVLIPFVQGSAKKLCIALISGMVMCLLGAYLNNFFGTVLDMDATEIARYVSPVVEESMRMLPVLLYTILLKPANKNLLAFAMVEGAGFATFENCCYIVENGADLIRFVLIRGLAVGVLHVVCGLLIGIGITMFRKENYALLPGIIGTFSLAMSVHALYNLLVSAGGFTAMIGFSIPLLMLVVVYVIGNIDNI